MAVGSVLLNGDDSSQPEGSKAYWPELEIKPGQRDASCQEEDAQDPRDGLLQALGCFGIGSFDLPVEKKEKPRHGKEKPVEPEHSEALGAKNLK